MERNMEITQQLVKELFEYRDGELYRRIGTSSNAKTGDKAGSLSGDGYLQTNINAKKYKNHRIIFLYHHGYLPEFIDHIDNNRLNNHINNLRETSILQNNRNARTRAGNTSGVKGVYWYKATQKWGVRINVNSKEKFFGYYHDINVAKFIVETMRNKYHGKFARHA